MPAKRFPWPVDQIRQWYEVENRTLQEIADILASDAWQPYWKAEMGREYRPNQKTLNSFCKRSGIVELRQTGAAGERNGSWNGGITIDKSGYVLVRCPQHPAASATGYVRQHRLVAEQMLGRYLTPTEVVHHKDDNKQNNDPSNLEVFETNAAHLAETLAGKCPDWTEDGKRRIAAGVEKAAQLKLSSRQ